MRRIIFEAPQRCHFALEHDDVIAQQPHFGIALDQSIAHAATRNRPHLRNAEGLLHVGASLVSFFDRRFEQAGHRALDLVLQFVNDRVQTYVDFLLIGQFLRLAFRTHIKSNDDRIRRRRQQHIGFRDRANARPQQLQPHFFVRQSAQQIAQHFDRSLHVGFQDDVQFLHARRLQLLCQAFERDA